MRGPGVVLPVLAVTGLAKERRLAARPGVVAVGAGGDTGRLRALLADRAPPGCRAVLSVGIAGGLDPDLPPGSVVIATAVAGPDHRHDVDAALVAALQARLDALTPTCAPLAGVETAAMTADSKRALRAATAAAAVDMESHVAADYAERHGLPFAALRVVCDPADRTLPAFAAHALKPDGEPDIAAVLSALARHEASLGSIVRLARDSAAAFRSLSRCCTLLGPGLGVPEPSARP